MYGSIISDTPKISDAYDNSAIRQAYPSMKPAVNKWDNGTYGNYWHNVETSNAPYAINDNNSDNQPLTAPVKTNNISISGEPATTQNEPEKGNFPMPAIVTTLSILVATAGLLIIIKKRKKP